MKNKEITRKEARKTLARIKQALADEGEISHLNITAMMDMMSILLVFMLKQFAVAQAAMTTSDALQLPKSSAVLKVNQAVNVSVTQNAIVIEGDPVVSVHGGAVDPSSKPDGANGYRIQPVVDTLTKHANRLKKLEVLGAGQFDHTIMLLVDRSTPYRLVTEVLYSAGQAEFSNYRLVVIGKGE